MDIIGIVTKVKRVKKQNTNITENLFEKVLTNENLFDIMQNIDKQMFRQDVWIWEMEKGENMIEVINSVVDDHSEIREKNRERINRRRRQQIRRQKHLFYIATFALIIIAGIALGSVHSYATQKSDVAKTKCYKSIMVESGDTLASIAADNMCVEFKSKDALVSEIKGINHLSDDLIHAGAYIVVPYYE